MRLNNLLLSSLIFSSHVTPQAAPNLSKDIPKNVSIQQRTKEDLRSRKTKIVAVIDTGADTSHPWIQNRLWENPGESGFDDKGKPKSSNGIDDDGNGFVDDLHGWNFLDNNNDLKDDNGHGTHIAGLISGEFLSFPIGEMSGESVKIMVLKYYSDWAHPDTVLRASVSAIEYALKMDADIINYSGGGEQKSLGEYIALLKADFQGKILVAAAGNEKWNLDQRGFFPASYPLKNVLRVAALRSREQLLEKSNYGGSTVDVAAPGFNILSAAPGNSAAVMSGTSQATALVSALLARYWSERPQMASHEVKQSFLKGLDTNRNLKNKIRGERIALGQVL